MSETAKSLEGPERLIGSRVLDFELKAVIGAGGMSVVYRGQHRVTGQEVAIKILPPELAVHEELKARFVEEARVLAKLEHPNIVHLNNFTETGGRLCLIMQYVEGVTFEQKIVEQGRVPADEALRVGIEVCRALEYAHAQGVVHRDIKPSNIIVRADGAVKVTDFGIAKMIGNTRLTSTGQTMGTVRYMSPEQVRGKAADARSDLYSLGITLYEALCGRTPFDGENHFDIMQQHLRNRPAPMAKLGALVPPSVERALLVALEKGAAERYPDAAAMRAALEKALPDASSGTGATVSSPSRLRSRLAPTLGLAVLVVAGAGATFLIARQINKSAAPPKPAAAPKPAPAPAPAPKPAAKPPMTWPTPHALAGQTVATDERFDADGLRVQSSQKRDVRAVRDAYVAILGELRGWLATVDVAAARALASDFRVPPLNLVIVPQAQLDDASLWPGFPTSAGMTYPSRYVDSKRTLFVNDTRGFERGDLAYGVALHVLTPVAALSDSDVLRLSEKFEGYYNSKAAR
jgi:tRNA A-37 threonylcarbamoyl transferase component Bud32